ncbi:hypothetical protein [Actinokineospora terrae]|uniref:Excreted virulence factor EspC, type VII ESX diderm n=1 Tax=Actinokineospora terrae TaxID=155974 RepID=A0A1H9VVC5_9PSEU|nr:hypothetical protein [Actinokineospora terrae]SES25481.1 hypothetical protein SAMN04487818_109107 [Actinokineospora terrae]
MTGYTVDPGELTTATTILRDATTSLADVHLDHINAGPGRLNGVVAAFTTDTQDALTSLASTLGATADTITTARDAYLQDDTTTTNRLR